MWSLYGTIVALPTGTPAQPLLTLEELLEHRNDRWLTGASATWSFESPSTDRVLGHFTYKSE